MRPSNVRGFDHGRWKYPQDVIAPHTRYQNAISRKNDVALNALYPDSGRANRERLKARSAETGSHRPLKQLHPSSGVTHRDGAEKFRARRV